MSPSSQNCTFGHFCTRYRKLGLHKLHLFYLLILYALFGGFIFQLLESDNQSHRLEEKSIRMNKSRKNLLEQIRIITSNYSDDQTLLNLIEKYETDNFEIPTKDKAKWDFFTSVYYAITIFTTIGFGDNAPSTTAGRVATVLYAIVGIPLLLALLTDVGQIWGCWLRSADARLRPALYQWWSNWKLRRGYNAEKAEDNAKCKEKIDFFIMGIGFALVHFWMIFCAMVFKVQNQQFTFFESIYFIFVLFSTIGLGDILPENNERMIFFFPLLIIGLSLASLCINLVKYQIEKISDKTQGHYMRGILETDLIKEIGELPEDCVQCLRFKMEVGEEVAKDVQCSHHPTRSCFNQVALGILQSVVINTKYNDVGVQVDL